MDQKIPVQLKKFIEKSRKALDPQKIILFGSRVRTDYLIESDYDIVIVADRFQEWDYHDRIVNTLKLMKPTFPVDLICVTPKEFNARKKQISIIQEAVREGVVLYEHNA